MSVLLFARADDAFTEPGSAEEEERIMGSVFAELGLNVTADMAEAPQQQVNAPVAAAETTSEEKELESRLNNLKRD